MISPRGSDPVRPHDFRRWLSVAPAAIALLACGAMRPMGTQRAPVWQVYAIRYATIRDFPVCDLVAGADSTRKTDIAMMFWYLEGPNRRRVLVDAGFYRKKFLDSWKPADYVRPSDAIERFGIPPDSITDVIISHVHWDHLDGADLFPRARIWIQREEYDYYVGANGLPLHPAIDTTDARMLFQLAQAGRVELVKGDGQELMPGLRVYTGGKHTYASQYVGVRTAKGTVVLASDNVYLYENLEKHVPIAQTLDAKSNLAAQDRMQRIAGLSRFIVPGHDPAVFTRFHEAGKGVVKVE
jgi:glyoxylase-like metal-dependent hydrolase (beta-lactamase superfamily II)